MDIHHIELNGYFDEYNCHDSLHPTGISHSGNKPFVIKQMVNAIACTIDLWYTREVAKHERSVIVARGDSRVRL